MNTKTNITAGDWQITHGGMDFDEWFSISSRLTNTLICDYGNPCLDQPWQETQANARLIAAAPELLEALNDLLAVSLKIDDREWAKSVSKTLGSDIGLGPCDKAMRAISKAIGKIYVNRSTATTNNGARQCNH